MTALRISLLLAMCLALQGCSTLRVATKPEGSKQYVSLPGVPFFTKAGRKVQETIYAETRYNIGLESFVRDADGKDKDVVVLARGEISGSDSLSSVFRELQESMNSGAVDEARTHLWSLGAGVRYPRPGGVTQLSNRTVDDVQVDYSTVYYLNARQPAFGSSEIAIELGADGTLSKVSAKGDEKTLTDVVPVKEAFEKVLDIDVPGAAAKAAPGPPSPVLQYRVTVSPVTYHHKFTKVLPADCQKPSATCPPSPIQFQVPPLGGVTYERTEAKAESPKKDPKPGDFNLSGHVELKK